MNEAKDEQPIYQYPVITISMFCFMVSFFKKARSLYLCFLTNVGTRPKKIYNTDDILCIAVVFKMYNNKLVRNGDRTAL